MDELRESSLLFSLESLLETERERVQREAREAQRRREDELKRVAELAERRRVSVQQEREARERREALEQERERLEQQRLEAMKRATVERARIEAEGQLRLIELEQTRQHDLQLAKLRETERATRYRTLSWLSSGALGAVLAGAVLAYLGIVQPAQARQEQRLQTLLGAAEQRVRGAEQALASERQKTTELAARVEQLRAAAVEVPANQAKPTSLGNGRGPHPPQLGGKPPQDKPCVDNGDPLNPCLKRRR